MVGTTVGYILKKNNSKGIILRAVSSKTSRSVNRARKIIGGNSGGILFTKDNVRAALESNCILICTPDDVIESVCKEISGAIKRSKRGSYSIIHFSGARSLRVLKSAEEIGASTASIHPLKSFASIEESIKTMPGTIFGVTGSSDGSKRIAKMIVKSLGGKSIEVEDEKKPLYHAAACISSNYIVTLLNYAGALYRKAGISPEKSLECMIGLAGGTIENVKRMGTEKSLTGPIVRGDTGTVREHVEIIRKYFTQEDTNLYKVLGLETAEIARINKMISGHILRELKKILVE